VFTVCLLAKALWEKCGRLVGEAILRSDRLFWSCNDCVFGRWVRSEIGSELQLWCTENVAQEAVGFSAL
jgi:hypothetical protein